MLSATKVDPGLEALRGAKAIAEFLYGDAGEQKKVYHLAERGELPIFRLGAILCARRSVLMRWIEAQEAKASKPTATPLAASPARRRRR